MKINRTYSVPINESTAQARVKTFFTQDGYQPAVEKGPNFTFKRGSGRGSWLGVNPAQVETEANIRITPEGDHVNIRADFNINLKFKDETNFTNEFWDSETKGLEDALFNDKYIRISTLKLTGKAFMAIVMSLNRTFTFILLWAAASLLLAFIAIRFVVPDSDPLLTALIIMVAVAIGTLYASRIWNRRQQRRPGKKTFDK